MIANAATLADGADLSADVCIVGAGAAGVTLALELRSSGLSVLLLESGTGANEGPLQDLYVGTRTGAGSWRLDEVRYRGFGGSTVLWAGYCKPLDPEDFEPRSYIPGGGWPIRYADLVPFYRRACTTLEIGAFEHDPVVLSARSGKPLLPFDPALVETQVYRFSNVRFGDRYRADLEAAANVAVYTNANVTAVRLTAPGGRVSHLECSTIEGVKFTATATRFVLALGGIENARMLLASNAEQPEGLANSSGRVGQFMEHPHYYQALATLWDRAPDLGFYQKHGVDGVAIQGSLSLAAQARAALSLPNFAGTFELLSTEGTGALARTTVSALLPSAQPTLYKLTLRYEQTASPESRIGLSDDLDALGTRRATLHWHIRPEDRAAIRASAGVIGRELGRLGAGRLFCPQHDEAGWDKESFPGSHHMGTTRMSTDPAQGVVNADLRAHDVENLYLAGASTFASSGDANPTMTLVALTHRLADHLKAGKDV